MKKKLLKQNRLNGILISVFILICSCNLNTIKSLSLLQDKTLSAGSDKQDESPQLVTNRNGEAWAFTLSRQAYPQQTEVISAFRFAGNKWEENPVALTIEGEYETPTAACAHNGIPAVSWADKDGGNWNIVVSLFRNNSFAEPATFKPKSGRFINPVIIAPDKDSYFLAWECFEKGRFSIFASRYNGEVWTKPARITKTAKNCWDPAITLGTDNKLYLAYTIADGVHQNIEMNIINASTLQISETVPVAIGGGFKDRVNLNSRAALAFDENGKLWISWENNRNNSRMEDSDSYTGDRICPIAYYDDHKLFKPTNDDQLFTGANDHFPTFVKDLQNQLYLITYCGGDFENNSSWKYRISWLDPKLGWNTPDTLYQTTQKGFGSRPQMIFSSDDKLWIAHNKELQEQVSESKRAILRKSELHLLEFQAPVLFEEYADLALEPRQVEEHHPVNDFFPLISGRLKTERRQINYQGETYFLLYGNLHEHTNISNCWPAGCDGSFDENYRYGLFSEGYDFMCITDHGNPYNEVLWRKNIRMAEFYDNPNYFVALPGTEWTLSSLNPKEKVDHASGHRNVIFSSSKDAQKYIKDENMIYSARTERTSNAEKLWDFIHEESVDCVCIPHHASDEVHPVCWETHDDELEPIVEIFQCRGSAEYPGCPKEVNLSRHKVSPFKNTYIDYALRDKKYKMGFVASGDHNSMGVGLAALWVKEISRAGILEALRSKRVYATTGDRIFIDFRLNNAMNGETVKLNGIPKISFSMETIQPIKSIELLRNSRVVKSFDKARNQIKFNTSFSDRDFNKENGGVNYYYLRVTQDNGHIAWSSPIWVEE